MKKIILALLGILFLISLAGCGGSKTAENYPTKPLELIVSWSAGGGSDRFGRAIAEEVKNKKLLPQPILINNKPGSNGIIGATYTAGKKGDSYVLLVNVTGDIGAWIASSSSNISPANFTPIAMLAWDEYTLMVKSNAPMNNLQELIAYTKANPRKGTFGGAGIGTVDHMLTTELVNKTGASIEYIPFEGGGEILSSILGGHVLATWANPAEAASQIKAGKLKAIAVAAPKRLAKMPDVQTVREQGYDVVFRQYRGIVGPAGMPKEHVKIIADAMKKVAESPEFINTYLERNSLSPDYKGPEEFAKIIADTEKIARQILKK